MTSSTTSKLYLEGKKLNKIEQSKAAKDGLEIGVELDHFAQIGWEDMDKTDLQLRLKWYGMFWRPKTPGLFMLRLRIPNGILTSHQVRVIASIIARYGEDGSCDITTRQNLQLRGVLINDLPEILKRLKEAALDTIQSGFDNPRNVTGNPLAGIDPNEIIDTRPYTKTLDEYLTNQGKGNAEFSNLPRKWNTAVAGAYDNFLLHNDIIFHPIERNGVMGFGVWIGGILSSVMNAYAIPLDAWVSAEEICQLTGVICSIWRDNGERSNRAKGRFRFYLDSIGIEKFRKKVEEQFGPLAHDPGSKFDAIPRNPYGIHKQKQPNLHYAGLHVQVGRLTAEDLQDLAKASEQYGGAEIRLTEDQNIILVGLPSHQLETFKNDPLLNKFPLNPGSIASGTVACTGNTYCSFALTNTKGQAQKVALALDKELEMPRELKIHWTGCPNSCGQAYMGAIGLTGTKVRSKQGDIVEGYNLTLGGSQGKNARIGKLHQKSIPKTEIKTVLREILIEHFGAQERKIKNRSKDPLSRFMNWFSDLGQNNSP